MSKTATTTAYFDYSHGFKSMRKEAGLSLRALSKKSGISYNTLWRMENGKYPTVETMIKWSEALGLEIKFELVPKATHKD